MKSLFKYATIVMFFISTLQISLFAQPESSYRGKYVEVILKNGNLLKGEVTAESEVGIQLKILEIGSWFVYTDEIKQIKIMTKETAENEINTRKRVIEGKINSKIEEENRKREALRTDSFEILAPSWGYYKGSLSTFFQPTIQFTVKNIGSTEIKKIYFKAIFFNKESKIMMGEDIKYYENIPPEYNSAVISLVCPSGWQLEGVSDIDKRVVAVEVSRLEVRFFWSENYSGSWKEMPYFSQYCK